MTISISRPKLPPLDEHEMGHVLTEMADQERDDGNRIDRPGWREILRDVGYPAQHVEEILERWFVKCTTCGQDATHLWAAVGEDGSISSINGNGKFSPSCDDCTGCPVGETPQAGVLRCPLDFDPQRQGRFDVQFHDDPGAVADWLCNRQEETLGDVLASMDQGYARQILTKAIASFARSVAKQSLNEIHQIYFDEVLLDLVIGARGSDV